MVKNIITAISEEDFRKLNLKVFKHERIDERDLHHFKMVEKSLNDILDHEITALIASGYEDDLKSLELPVTIAIHEPPTEIDIDDTIKTFKGLSKEECVDYALYMNSYLDKYMNRFSGAQTYQLGLGIRHLYSTRDYYEAHEDYWRVRKDETKVIYRINLSDHWKNEFVLKHKSVTEDWPYNELPEGVSPDYEKALLVINYDLQEDGSWKEIYRYGRFIYKYSEHHIPIDINGVKKSRV